MQPRRKQTPITIRSDRAAARLKLFTRDGRSQVEIIEEALERMPLPPESAAAADAPRERIEAILDRLANGGLPTMAQFDREEYDEIGNPR